MELTLYHNPKCSNSRGVNALLEEHAASITIIEYLKSPLDKDAILELLTMLPGPAHDLLRTKEAPYTELGLNSEISADTMAEAIAQHPVLMQRPVVVHNNRAIIARPPAILEAWLTEG